MRPRRRRSLYSHGSLYVFISSIFCTFARFLTILMTFDGPVNQPPERRCRHFSTHSPRLEQHPAYPAQRPVQFCLRTLRRVSTCGRGAEMRRSDREVAELGERLVVGFPCMSSYFHSILLGLVSFIIFAHDTRISSLSSTPIVIRSSMTRDSSPYPHHPHRTPPHCIIHRPATTSRFKLFASISRPTPHTCCPRTHVMSTHVAYRIPHHPVL